MLYNYIEIHLRITNEYDFNCLKELLSINNNCQSHFFLSIEIYNEIYF
jgi:hypothetical protein